MAVVATLWGAFRPQKCDSMATKKSEAERLKAALLEEQIAELRLKDFSLRHIMKEVKLKHPEDVRRIIRKVEKRWENEAVEHAKLMLQKDLRRLELIANEAWQAWARSVGKKEKQTSESKGVVLKDVKSKGKGRKKARWQDEEEDVDFELESQLEAELEKLGGLAEHKEKTVSWYDAGDPRFLAIVKDCLIERNRLLGTYDKTDDDGDGALEAVRFLQDIYIPGLGLLTPELLVQLMKDAPPMPGDVPNG